MTIVDVRIHKIIVPMKPDTVHSTGIDDKLCAPHPLKLADLPLNLKTAYLP